MTNWFVLAFFSAALSAASTLFEKKVLFKIDAFPFALLMSAMGLLLTLPFLALQSNLTAVNPLVLLLLFFKAFIGAFAFLYVMHSLKYYQISRALPIMALTPGLVAVCAFFFLGEGLKNIEVAGMLMLLIGTYILEARHHENIWKPWKLLGEINIKNYMVIALLLMTVSSLLDKLLLGKLRMPPVSMMIFQQFFFFLSFVIIGLFYKDYKIRFIGFDRHIYGIILLIAALTVGYRFTQILAVKLAPVALVLAVKRISVFFAVILGGKIFKEEDLFKKAIATAVIIAGALLISGE